MLPAQALVLVDIQAGFVRQAGSLVVHLQNDGTTGSPDEPGTPGWVLRLDPAAGEPVLRKRDDDGFEDTELDALLADRRVRRLVIAGLLSEMCVSATARAALRRGYQVVLPHDAHATYGIPEAAGLGASAVPASVVARVAERALADGVELAARAADVRFAASPG
ncbi:MAG TPA: isochorismatase family protein [Streptosporangiaceae bacterium]|jgi:nicotinamidase-related amidase